MPLLTCLCGEVRINVRTRPDFINECNCELCSKTGARWAYFDPQQVSVEGNSHGYRRPDKDDPNAEVHFCLNCGATTHFVLTESAVAKFGNSLVGVNMWLADPRDLAGIELRYPDGRSWSGEGDFSFVREPLLID
jgi:hypothetical protein